MAADTIHVKVPRDGLGGLKDHWKSDLSAAFSVAMVALPLGLGVAQASGISPMAGVTSAAIGGLVTTFFRSSHVGINGPTPGLITVILAATVSLGHAKHVFGAIVVAGALQLLFGLLKLGRLGEVFPSSVIRGLLAAIGVIIFTTQLDDALGFAYSPRTSILQKLAEVPVKLLEINPLIAAFGLFGILILLLYPKINHRLLKLLPAPMWVLVAGVVVTVSLGLQSGFSYSLFGKSFTVGSASLINIPSDISKVFVTPSFELVGTPKFWGVVFSIFLIASVESLASSKAVDKLDPFQRTTDLNKDLAGVGISTMISGALGGLPIITVIVRSSVNIHNGGKTRWSNFFHGLILVLFILLFAPLLMKVPLAALGAILVYTGYKLAGPRAFIQTSIHGWEQVLFMVSTMIVTLATDLLVGLFTGMLLCLLYHLASSRMTLRSFLADVWNPTLEVVEGVPQEGDTKIEPKSLLNFLNLLKLKRKIDEVPKQRAVTVDLSESQLIDLSVMEFLQTQVTIYARAGGTFRFTGYESHIATTSSFMALRTRNVMPAMPLGRRERQLKALAEELGWSYTYELEWENSNLRAFHFFETRPIEYKKNILRGRHEALCCDWEIADITFDEGALEATEVYECTVEVIHVPFELPRFALEEEGWLDKIFDRLKKRVGFVDIDFHLFPDFSNRFLLEGENEEEIRRLFTPTLIEFLESGQLYHIESNGRALLLFRRLRLAKIEDIKRMAEFARNLVEKINLARQECDSSSEIAISKEPQKRLTESSSEDS